ncbi:unnamed protein product [Effrenium voratum]|uniref:Uncharacterized protein n=1 Tax=Effrenium voratum TaxID=2562239 RepID=A0AA36NHE0_9DINO|nr:unnamed protein product [Effrenium voratum]
MGAIIVPGQLRQMDTVFKVWGLQVMGVSSARSETDEWVLKSCGKCKKAAPCQAHPDAALEPRMAVRVDLLILTASVPCCCTTTFSQRSCRTRTSPVCSAERRGGRCALRWCLPMDLASAQWLCKLTFRENDYQQVLELDCKHLEPFLEPQKPAEDLARFMQVLPRCALGKGCPVASLDVLNVDNELGILRAGQLDASAARVPSTTSSSPTRKLFSKIHSRPRPCE